jgi:very-short-patch-repair endonuclease
MNARQASSSRHVARREGLARSMRQEPTASERLLWAELSGGKLGVWFRRQVVVGASIVDFMAPARRLIVEVDGCYHCDVRRQRADARRDKRLERAGYRVLRLSAEQVLGNLPEAVQVIVAALA